MMIEVNVLRAEQSWDLDTKRQQNYLVVEVFGIETRIPCTEDQLVRALGDAMGFEVATPEDDDGIPFEPVPEEPRAAPVTFVGHDEPTEEVQAPTLRPRRQGLAPMGRQRDDAGIGQG